MYKVFEIREKNIMRKNLLRADIKVAICYPSIYRVAVSSLGYQLIYFLLNSQEEIACERAVLSSQKGPEPPVKTLESGSPLKFFDIIIFSVHYELDYPNIARMLLASGINPLKHKRGLKDPIVVVGGPPITANPVPLESIADVLYIGEAEYSLLKLVYEIHALENRKDLYKISDIKGVYVPGSETRAQRAWVRDLDKAFHPSSQIIPLSDKSEFQPVFGRAAQLEVTRGCGRGCRFCLLGYSFRPYRERSFPVIESLLKKIIEKNGVLKIVLIGSSLSDYKYLQKLLETCIEENIQASLPALRTDAVEDEVLELIPRLGQRTLTFAPETSIRLRIKLNKPIENSEIIEKTENAVAKGVKNIKLYFLYGVPGESKQDLIEIVELVKRIKNKVKLSKENIRVSINPLIPKAHTPLQWTVIEEVSILRRKRRFLLEKLGSLARVEGYDPFEAQIQALLSLGGSQLGEIVAYVAEAGGGRQAWRKALRRFQINVQKYLEKTIAKEPWSVVDVGVSRDFLEKEYKKFHEGILTPPCSTFCSKCGVC